jgi:hypothetical protein
MIDLGPISSITVNWSYFVFTGSLFVLQSSLVFPFFKAWSDFQALLKFCDRAYGSFVNWSVIAIILISITLMQATRNGSDLWLAHWVDINSHVDGEDSLNFYLVILSKPSFIACNMRLKL